LSNDLPTTRSAIRVRNETTAIHCSTMPTPRRKPFLLRDPVVVSCGRREDIARGIAPLTEWAPPEQPDSLDELMTSIGR
jgi:hypothetical protein